jgi:hypothetical protein
LTPWYRQRASGGGFRTWLAAVDDACDLSILVIGTDRFSWLVRRDDRDIAEGEAGDLEQAKRAAETAGAAAPLPEQQQLTERSR